LTKVTAVPHFLYFAHRCLRCNWKEFLVDEEWIAIKKASTAKFGDLVDEVQDRSLDMLP